MYNFCAGFITALAFVALVLYWVLSVNMEFADPESKYWPKRPRTF